VHREQKREIETYWKKGKSILEEEIDVALRSENVKYLEHNRIL
jgi:hypothetical protein